MKKIRQILDNKLWLITIAFVLLFTFAVSAQDGGVERQLPQEPQQEENYTKADAFQDVMFLLQNYYVEDVEFETLIEGAIDGMLNEVDRYSYFMSPSEYEEMQQEYEGHYGGIGIVITMRDNKLTIVSPIKNTPGERAGLRAGDIITAIDGQKTAEMSQMKAVDLMRGEEGTDVTLTIDRGDEDPFDVEITREDIEVPYVETEMKTEEIGYISLAQFIENVGTKVETAVADLKEQGARGIILDLRNNPGGLLNEAVDVSSVFLDEGVIVSVKQKDETERVLEVNKNINADTKIPLIVLVNKGSASGSEIVAGAVKDYDRGKLMGTTTFGKGVVQSVIPLKDGSAVSLTTARYYTPAGNYIHDKGITPDIKVELDLEAAQEDGSDNQLDQAVEEMENMIFVRDFQDKKASGE
ncbi:carboxyl-terminal processing protease [Halanaerobium saccharolyticum]|uniref:Carboxyl-terminal processing protease n=1 Tax=Halanaerobium saccharolyticum TaxID=43595 RepID=A0A4R7Z862_9FIRM|nr:S41 family peptidase [Halanaerobium saccharolyticum]RAK09760.1 carboxyl-terminal processing protease [Halanaerobium saccharolyticum]TDW07322.1 carboxyl-terminal processing protease [Halanaerobium saccharolyticum]TDX61201.1 carboxyl-terminal processing protease [Halanaerobium saccharolyticum]